MDFEGSHDTTITPRTSKQKSLKTLGTFVKKRLSTKKSAKSERTVGSMDDSEDGTTTPLKKQNTFTTRLKKRFSTGREPSEISARRSFSAADLAALDNMGQEQSQVDDDEVTATESVTPSEESMPKQVSTGASIRAAQPTDVESFLYPRTPVPSQDITAERLRSGDGRSSSSHHVSSGNEEIVVVDEDSKEMRNEQQEEEGAVADPSSLYSPKKKDVDVVVEPLAKEVDDQQRQGIQYLGDSPDPKDDVLDYVPADAAATIDVGIEETVAASFENIATTTTDHPLAIDDEKETVVDEGTVAKVVQTRDVDLSDLMPTPPPPTTEAPVEGCSSMTVVPDSEKSVAEKPTKKRKARRFKLRHASFSLAGIAVGLLLIILKAKA